MPGYSDLDVIFMTKAVPDYLHDAIYLGLHELGCNLIDYPRKSSLHGEPCPSEYHSGQLYLDLPDNSLRKDNPDLLIVTALMHDRKSMGDNEWKQYVYDTYKKFNPQKVIILDGQDKSYAVYPTLDKDYDMVFKRELPYRPYKNWEQISFAGIPEPFKYVYYPDREYDISCVLGISVMYRVDFCRRLKELSDKIGLKSFIHIDRQTIPRSRYLEVLANSRVSFSVRGMGLDCYRYWEVPVKGTVLASENINLPIYKDFDESMCFKFDGNLAFDSLEEVLLDIKRKDHEELQEMGLNGLKHALMYHTPSARAKWMLDKVFGN